MLCKCLIVRNVLSLEKFFRFNFNYKIMFKNNENNFKNSKFLDKSPLKFFLLFIYCFTVKGTGKIFLE